MNPKVTLITLEAIQDSTDGLRQCVRPFKSAYHMDETLVNIRSPSMWMSGRIDGPWIVVRVRRGPILISVHINYYTKIKTLTVTIPSGLKTSLTRPKVPQGNKPGAESPQKALLDYGKALPGYYSG